ncbi:MAG: dienelactone hydrolase family protein [Chloroflexi bacterium]|nr:dienelactone hydrolase family protein [Chloroflexota bacterium]
MDRTKQAIVDECPVRVRAGAVTLEGSLCLPVTASGIVLFAHGSGSSRHSPRNQSVARVLRDAGMGTLLFDLLTADEETEDMATGRLRFDIPLLSRRLVDATNWLLQNPDTRDFRLGYFGASTGAAAALIAATERPEAVHAVVSRGGRPDLAAPVLHKVKAPTLLIVGGRDYPVIELNRVALARLTGEKKLVIVPGATHLFEEPGTLEEVARLAAEWFASHFRSRQAQ